jgi:hypothetical protein
MDEKPLKPTEQQGLTIQRVDLPELSETFADSIESVVFDGQTLRINCGVTRYEQSKQTTTAHRYPACRLVLTLGAAVELANQLQKQMAAMIQSGVLKPTTQPPAVKVP